MTLQKLVSSLIYAEHGWAVRDQFEASYEDAETMEEQNSNALAYVSETISELLISDLLAHSYEVEELRQYHKRLEGYLSQA